MATKNIKICIVCFLAILSLLLGSCSIQKRKYTGGFSVQFRKSFSTTALAAKKAKREEEQVLPIVNRKVNNVVHLVSDSNLQLKPHVEAIKPKEMVYAPEDSCARLYMMDGKVYKVKIHKKAEHSVSFYWCDTVSGTKEIVMLSDVHAIKYANGKREIIQYRPVKEVVVDEPVVNTAVKIPEEKNDVVNGDKVIDTLNTIGFLMLFLLIVPEVNFLLAVSAILALIATVLSIGYGDVKRIILSLGLLILCLIVMYFILIMPYLWWPLWIFL